ncbi:anthranilate synthase component II [Holophaga foetida]|uniref:anthranilate synthase component II n=1 Tax=Holophaga foetida TaxID=35839 RepID=UPI0002474625|nr:aminodeoxychorismate/anthranilate synthase component II [Holophaga foetida]
MILVIDNYDSFTYNLVQLLGGLHPEIRVVRNDAMSPAEILALNPDYLILSPGPGNPSQAGNLLDIVKECGPHIPTFGVCLGQQAIAQAFGGQVVPAPSLVHGKASPVYHNGEGIFAGLPNPMEAGRYHSLMVDADTLPACFTALAHSGDGVLQAIAHREFPIQGVQFHPESVLTPQGTQMLRNFLRIYRRREVNA